MKYSAERDILYLDNAATTFPKPRAVISEVTRCMEEYCGNPGRGSHSLARAASEKLFVVREQLSDMFDAPSAENVVFTLNTTYAVNTALKSVVTFTPHILLSDMEHNSVSRPVAKLAADKKAKFSFFGAIGDENTVLEDIKRKITPNTKILICQHASNICGNVLPIEKIGMLCKKYGIFFIVDAAQSAGAYDISIKKMNIDALCIPSHKGLYGPQGVGAVIFSERMASCRLETLIEGGSGTNSKSPAMPDVMPDRFEAGTMPTPVIAGLSAGLDFVKKHSAESIGSHERYLGKILTEELSRDKNITLYLPEKVGSVVLFNIAGKSSVYVSEMLDKAGICTRAGLHCAPLAHKKLMTGDGGAVRVSFGAFNDKRDIIRLLDSINSIKKNI